MLIYVDIDNTICRTEGGYDNAKPIPENIAKINKLFDEGHIIVYWTARGQATGKDWTELTVQQLIAWGCKYHDVIMRQKPSYDLLIDDKSIRIEEIDTTEREEIESLLDFNDDEIKGLHNKWDKGDCSLIGLTEIYLYQLIKRHKRENGLYYDTDYDNIKLRYGQL